MVTVYRLVNVAALRRFGCNRLADTETQAENFTKNLTDQLAGVIGGHRYIGTVGAAGWKRGAGTGAAPQDMLTNATAKRPVTALRNDCIATSIWYWLRDQFACYVVYRPSVTHEGHAHPPGTDGGPHLNEVGQGPHSESV